MRPSTCLITASSIILGANNALVAANGGLRGRDPWKLFNEFKAKYNMFFESPEEDARRFGIFRGNLQKADELNSKDPTAKFGVTKFAHLTATEFADKHNGYKRNANRKQYPKKVVKKVKTGSIDWRDLGGVSPVKDQGQCGSCWAFSATEAIETGYWKDTGDMKVLSPQQIVSCDMSDGACNGGDTYTAYEYVEEAGGIEAESDYPYTSGGSEVRGRCKADESAFTVKIDGVNTVSESDDGEEDMYSAIMESAISVCVDAESWQMYMGGVVTSATCGAELDHCVQAVGIKEGEYWIVKNQWNTDWGEEGYIRVKTGENACGIALEATTVTASAEYRGHKKSVQHNKKQVVQKKRDDGDITQAVIDVIRGVSEGFGLHMEDKCITDSETFLDKIDEAVKLLEKKTPLDVMEAMQMIAEALKIEWPAAAAACSATAEELRQIIASLEIMSHPKDFVYHVGKDLVINGIDIYKNVNDSVGHWKAKEYHEFGFSVGTALGELLVGSKVKGVVPSDEIYV